MLKPESKIVEKLIAWIKAQGGDAWKVHGSIYQRKGEPDIDGWLPPFRAPVAQYEQEGVTHKVSSYYPLHLKIEVKVPGEKPDPLQAKRLATYSDARYCAGSVTSVEELQEVIRKFKETYNA